VALGTVLSADGDILSKASELPEGTLECVLPDGRVVAVQRRGVDPDWDVALLRVRAAGLQPVALARGAVVGRWAFSPDKADALAAVGTVGVAEMPVRGRGLSSGATSKAYMGVRLEPAEPEALRAQGLPQGVRVFVEPDLPAARAGLRSGDIVFEADGGPVRDPDSLMDLLVDKQPGDTLSVRLARGDERLSVTVHLTTRPARLPGRGGLPAMLSGEVSRMQGPFPRVLHHDGVLPPSAMGGPLLDSEGRCIGLNIARADRTATYAIPAADLQEIYARLKEKRDGRK
jgi:serine protease Do